MRISKRARIGAGVMALFVLAVFVLIMLAVRPNQMVHKAEDLNAYDIAAPAAPAAYSPTPAMVTGSIRLR